MNRLGLDEAADVLSRFNTPLVVHPDFASAEFHMKVAGPVFRKFTDLIKLSRIDIYGNPGPELLERIRQKAHMLGSRTVACMNFTPDSPGSEAAEDDGRNYRPSQT